MTDVDARVSPSLHPAVFGTTDDPIITSAAADFSVAYRALVKLHDAREVANNNPLITKEAASFKVADLASKTLNTVTRSIDNARKKLGDEADSIRKALQRSVSDDGARLNTEIRAHCKALKLEDRIKLLEGAIEQNDQRTLRALLGGPSYLSGLTPEIQAAMTLKANRRREPEQSARLSSIEGALNRVDQISILLVSEQVEKGMGARWRDIERLHAKQKQLEQAFK